MKEIENARNSEDEETRTCFSLKDELDNLNYLLPIVRDHPDVIGEGHAEVYLHILSPRIDKVSLDEAVSLLRKHTDKLQKLRDFKPEDDPALPRYLDDPPDGSFDTFVVFDPEEEDEVSVTAFELRIRVSFDGDDLLRTVVQRIDKVIEPLKEIVDKLELSSGLPSYHPF